VILIDLTIIIGVALCVLLAILLPTGKRKP